MSLKASKKLFAQASLALEQGDVESAYRLHHKLFKIDPKNFEAMHSFGLVYLARGDLDRAIHWIRRGMECPSGPSADHLSNLGHCLNLKGDFRAAKEACQAALLMDQSHDGAWSNLGNAERGMSNVEAAIRCYEESLVLVPTSPRYLCNLALACFDSGSYDRSKELFIAALKTDANMPEAHLNLASCYLRIGDSTRAADHASRAAELSPNCLEAWNTWGLALLDLGRALEALVCFDRCREFSEENADVWANKGHALTDLGRQEEAVTSLDRAIFLDPTSAQNFNNRGVLLQELGRYEEAMESFKQALTINPSYPEAWNSRGHLLSELSQNDEARKCFDTAISLRPDYHDALLNKGLICLRGGDFTEGWPLYESRWQADWLVLPTERHAATVWSGKQSLDGKSILIWAEQGFGDSIQFCRYIKHLLKSGAKIIFQVQRPLIGLMESVDSNVRVISFEDSPGHIDYHCPLLSLPLAFGTRRDNIPAEIPYIQADKERIHSWTVRLGERDQRLRIGICWAGNPNQKNNRRRSIPLSLVSTVFDEEYQWFSLKKDLNENETRMLDCLGVADYSPEINSFADTAALISNLDLIISVCTSVAHLAGSMGKPVWILLPKPADFRWLEDIEYSPWYPTARLFRQCQKDVWEDVLLRVKNKLKEVKTLKIDGRFYFDSFD